MNTTINSYKALKIECDKDGFPTRDISDLDIKQAYLKCLENLYIGTEPKEELNQSEILQQRTKQQEFLMQTLEGKDIETKIKMLETMLENKEYIQSRQPLKESIEFLKEKYSTINTEEKRKEYTKHLNREKNKNIIHNLDEYSIPTTDLYLKTDFISYGDLRTKENKHEILYIGKNIRLFQEEEYECEKITERAQISSIATNAILSKSKIYRCSLNIRKDENYDWQTKDLYLEPHVIEIFRRHIEEAKDIRPMLEEKENLMNQVMRNKEILHNFQKRKEAIEEIMRGILTELENSIENETSYIGEVINTESGIVCIKDRKMEEKVNELEIKRNSEKTKMNYYEGENR